MRKTVKVQSGVSKYYATNIPFMMTTSQAADGLPN